MTDSSVLGIVPARSGSKGIKKKNIVEVAGRPLISYVIETLQESDSVDRIVCTTDGDDIAEVARDCGAEVPFMRPEEMARDDSEIFNALAHAAEKTVEVTGFEPDYAVTAQPTYPLVKPEHVDDVIEKVEAENGESAITAVELDHDAHPYNIRQRDEQGRVSFWKEEKHYEYPNRQQKPTFYQFGNIFVTEYDQLVDKKRLEGEENYMVEIDRISSLDVNTPADLDIVEYHIRARREGNGD